MSPGRAGFACLVIFLLLRPFIDGLTYPLAQFAFEAAVLCLLLAWAVLLAAGRAGWRPTGLEWPALGFLAVLCLSAVFSETPYRSAVFTLRYLHYFLLFFLAAGVCASPGGEAFRRAAGGLVLVTSLLVAAYGLHQYFWGFSQTLAWIDEAGIRERLPPELVSRLASRRVFSTFTYPNLLGGFLAAMVPPALGFAGQVIGARERHGVAVGVAAAALPAVLLAVLFLTRSAGALIVLAMAGTAAAAFRRPEIITPGKAFPALAGLALIGAGLVRFLPAAKLLTLEDRLLYWGSSLLIWARRPLLGSGPGSFGVLYAGFRSPMAMETQHAHSAFFELLAETGPGGAFFFCLFFFLLLRNCRAASSTPLEKGFFWGSLVLFLHSQFDFNLANPSLGSYLFLLPLFAAARREKPGRAAYSGGRAPRHLTVICAMIIILAAFPALARTVRLYRAESLFRSGMGKLESGDWSAGLPLAARAAVLEGGNPAYHAGPAAFFHRAWRETGEGHWLEAALEGYRRAVEVEPRGASFHYRLGTVAEDLAAATGDPEWLARAAVYYRRASRLHPAREDYADAFRRTGQLAPPGQGRR